MRRFGWIWLLGTALVAGVSSYFSYQAGLASGLAAKLPAGAAPYYLYGPHWGFGFFPFFPLFGLFWFLLFLFFIFGIARAMGRGRHHGGWNREERLRDWHRQAHEQEPPSA